MNQKVLQDSIFKQNKGKGILKDINSGRDNRSMRRNSFDQSIKKFPRSKDSRIIEHEKIKQLVKCWKCGGNHLLRNCPTKENKKGSNHRVSKLMDYL